MDKQQFVHVSEAFTSAILERKRVHPVFLHRNSDNSFTAVFAGELTSVKRESIKAADDTIVLLELEMIDDGQAAVEINPKMSARFAFTSEPTDYS